MFWNRRCKPNVYRVDDAVRTRLAHRDVLVRHFLSETLMPFPSKDEHTNFDDFQSYTRYCFSSLHRNPPPLPSHPISPERVNPLPRDIVREHLSAREPDFLRHSPTPFSLSTVLPDVDELDLLDGLRLEGRYLPGDVRTIGCVAAMKTLQNFINSDRFQRFAEDNARRDGMVIGDELATSRLSPHIRFGEISPRVLFYAVIDAGASAIRAGNMAGLCAARTFIKNMSLREFGYYMLARYPHAAYKPIVPEFNVFPWIADSDGVLREAWERGTTGFPIVDAAMRQLWREGWLHNKMRFLVASFFCKYLMLPWPIGAAYLVRALVDGDEACNSLGWQWTAGCNSDAFPFSTLVNPVSYRSHTRLPTRAAKYVRKYVPELAHLPDRLLFTPWKANAEERIKYNLILLPIGHYRSLTRNRLPPMNERCSHFSPLYPLRIIDLKDARTRSLDAMSLMRRIFSAQRHIHTLVVEQVTPYNSDDETDERSTYHGGLRNERRREHWIYKSKACVDGRGADYGEIDITHTGADSSENLASELTTVSIDNASSDDISYGQGGKRSFAAEHVAHDWNAIGRELKRPRTVMSEAAVRSEQQSQQRRNSKCDLLALCEVVTQSNNNNTHHGTNVPAEIETQFKSKARLQLSVSDPPADEYSDVRISPQVKRLRRMDVPSTDTISRAPVVDVLAKARDGHPPSNASQFAAPNVKENKSHVPRSPAAAVPSAPTESGLPGLAQVASAQLPIAPPDTYRLGTIPLPTSPWSHSVPRTHVTNATAKSHDVHRTPDTQHRVQPLHNLHSNDNTSASTTINALHGRSNGSSPALDGQAAKAVVVPTSSCGNTPSAATISHTMYPTSPLAPMVPGSYASLAAAAAAAAAAASGHHPNAHQHQAHPHAQTPAQLLMSSYHRHPHSVAPMPTAAHLHHPLTPLHPASQSYFTQPSQPFIWYHAIQPYVDMHTGLPAPPTAAGVMPHMLQPFPGMHVAYPSGNTATPSGPPPPPPPIPPPPPPTTNPAGCSYDHSQNVMTSAAAGALPQPHGLHSSAQAPTQVQVMQNSAALGARPIGLVSMHGGMGTVNSGRSSENRTNNGRPNGVNSINSSGAMRSSSASSVNATGPGATPPFGLTALGVVGSHIPAHIGSVSVQTQTGPNTPQEREAIARRMAAMDYQDDNYNGKHWEQWQAIALHLLNSYEFSNDTDRETSRAYVRLCVLKDELRDANPSGPRVTVNHCKEVFKILRLPVTGEWDRRGHGGVRGPYVYGCSKRASSAITGDGQGRNG